MKHKFLYIAAVVAMMIAAPVFSSGLEDLQTKKLTQDRVKLFPVPSDNINYIFLQSIENDTFIVIGDFSGLDKKIIFITDNNNDNTIDLVTEYYPLTKDLKKRNESRSKFFNKDIAKLREITPMI